MKVCFVFPCSVLALGWAISAVGATHYVDLSSTNAAPPFADWGTAATNIQDAVDVAAPGDLVLVTNGVYITGGPTNYVRVNVTNALTLQSVNGPLVTVIDGSNTVRCVELAEDAVLCGFTLQRGNDWARGGAVDCSPTYVSGPPSALVANCLVISNYAGYEGGGIAFAVVSNCVFAYNSCYAESGGGALVCTVYNSVFSNNFAPHGGGAGWSTLNNCLLFGNTALDGGGAAYLSDLNNCLVISNSSPFVGGALSCDLSNCTVCGNSTGMSGDGLAAGGVGGDAGPMAYTAQIKNSIVYYNSPTNWDILTLITNTCTTPLAAGTGKYHQRAFVHQSGRRQLSSGLQFSLHQRRE